MTLWLILWLVPAGFMWRILTGHFAWEIHRSADTQKTIKPPVENWILSALFIGLPLALLWPITLLFTMRWPFKLMRGAEKEEWVKYKDLRQIQSIEATREKEKLLGIGDYALKESEKGEVID